MHILLLLLLLVCLVYLGDAVHGSPAAIQATTLRKPPNETTSTTKRIAIEEPDVEEVVSKIVAAAINETYQVHFQIGTQVRVNEEGSKEFECQSVLKAMPVPRGAEARFTVGMGLLNRTKSLKTCQDPLNLFTLTPTGELLYRKEPISVTQMQLGLDGGGTIYVHALTISQSLSDVFSSTALRQRFELVTLDGLLRLRVKDTNNCLVSGGNKFGVLFVVRCKNLSGRTFRGPLDLDAQNTLIFRQAKGTTSSSGSTGSLSLGRNPAKDY